MFWGCYAACLTSIVSHRRVSSGEASGRKGVKPPNLPPVALIGGSPESPSIQGALKKILPLCSVVQCFSLFHAFDVESFRLSPVAQTFFGAKKFFGQKRFATGRGRPTERSLAGGLPLNMI
eukprot:GHVU01127876.1.p7 GENE.GHVU01127876.1~~GHVU01127876.1.p7  ORF type:complete len:121 (-),score=4.18 GHVU01127876.1:1542-1904(-)